MTHVASGNGSPRSEVRGGCTHACDCPLAPPVRPAQCAANVRRSRAGPATYSPSDTVLRPHVPTLNLAAGCGRLDVCAAPLVPEGDVLLLQPSHALVERGAPAVDFSRAGPRFAEVDGEVGAAEGDTLWLELGVAFTPHGVAFVRQAGMHVHGMCTACACTWCAWCVVRGVFVTVPLRVCLLSVAPSHTAEAMRAPYAQEVHSRCTVDARSTPRSRMAR